MVWHTSTMVFPGQYTLCFRSLARNRPLDAGRQSQIGERFQVYEYETSQSLKDAKRMRQTSAWWYQIWPLSILFKIGCGELINPCSYAC